MEVYYRFRATEDQYKKKFREWYKSDILLPKKRKREDTSRGTSKRTKAASSLKDGCLTPWSPRRLEESATTPPADHFDVKEEDKQLMTLEERIGKLNFSQLPQQEYMQQLGNLWDVHFDAKFGKAELVDVQDAVENWKVPEQRNEAVSIFIDSAQDWQKEERRKTNFGDILLYCCNCGDGPYLNGVSNEYDEIDDNACGENTRG
ncbi:hypothetical protein E8E11_004533 [Didymella keratinophila]|nr:hypothetical protein E8E11_004533 [Didymella keratinophila]